MGVTRRHIQGERILLNSFAFILLSPLIFQGSEVECRWVQGWLST
jgi:hypothetical protein